MIYEICYKYNIQNVEIRKTNSDLNLLKVKENEDLYCQ